MTFARHAVHAIAPDPTLIAAGLALVTLGLFMIDGATTDAASTGLDGATQRQAIYLSAGLLAFVGLRRLDYRLLQRWSPWVYLGSTVALVLVLALGTDAHGARRWIDIGPATIQPSGSERTGATASPTPAASLRRSPSTAATPPTGSRERRD